MPMGMGISKTVRRTADGARPSRANMTNTKTLFSSLVKALDADCICDIGSRDGKQSLLFRRLRPKARVLAFEANPANAGHMRANAELKEAGIEIHQIAVADREGTMDFHLCAVSEPGKDEIVFGSSSLLPRVGQAAEDFQGRGTTQVKVRRLDDVLRENCPEAKRIALWIDAEGAEHMILQGITGFAERLFVLHVETAVRPLFQGQRTLPMIEEHLKPMGFVPCADNITEEAGWGDVVFVREEWARRLGPEFAKAKRKALLTHALRADEIAVMLKSKWPWLYRTLHGMYVKFT